MLLSDLREASGFPMSHEARQASGVHALLLFHLCRQSTLARHDDARSGDAAGPNAEPEDSSMASFALAFDRRKKRKYSDKHTELFRQRQSRLSQSILADGQMVWTFWRSLVVLQKACVISPEACSRLPRFTSSVT